MSPKTRTLPCMLAVVWTAALSFPFVDGLSIMSDAGHCSLNEFWYAPIQDCVPLGRWSFESDPPSGMACPSNGNWYWSTQLSLCLPASPVSDALNSRSACPNHYTWDATTSRCIQLGGAACSATEFWFSDKAICLPRRASSPPTMQCPSGWYWSAQRTSCVPANPEAILNMNCGSDSVWSPSTLKCQRATSPSRRSSSSASRGAEQQLSHRHNLKSRSINLCPAPLDACPILRAGDLSDYECVDPIYDLQHCGGCSVDGLGQDCTAIEGVWNVECMEARCSVLTCLAGYLPSINRKACVKL